MACGASGASAQASEAGRLGRQRGGARPPQQGAAPQADLVLAAPPLDALCAQRGAA